MKNYIFAILIVILVLGVVTVPTYAADQSIKTKNEYLKTLKVPSGSNPYNHDHNTNVQFPKSSLSKQNPTNPNGGDTNKAQGNYVAGQPWGSSTVTAKQATQAQNTQNSHQAQNAHQATQAQQAHESQPSHKTTPTLPTLPNNQKYPVPKLPGH